MLKLTCDHCGFEIKLIHTLDPKREETDGGDGQGYRLYWELSSEQDGIGYSSEGKYFDREPNELAKWNWVGPVGTPDKDYLGGHYCDPCKKEFKEYMRNYKADEIYLVAAGQTQIIDGVPQLKVVIGELEERLKRHRREYVEAFKKKL